MRCALLLLCASALWAGEVVTLSTGYTMKVDRHEWLSDGRCRLHTAKGYTDVPADQVISFELVPDPVTPIAVEAPKPAEPPPPAQKSPEQLVEEAAIIHGLPPEFVRSVAKVESAFNPKAISRAGAIGLMQLMPQTAQSLGVNPHDAAQNAEAGARYLRDLLIKYQNHPNPVRRALAAYNAGEGAVDRYNGIPPYRETQLYVEKVLDEYWRQVRKGKSAQ